MIVEAQTEATGRTASASEGAIGPPGCDAPVDSAHERYCSARMNDTAQQKTRIKPENTSCTMGAVSQKRWSGRRRERFRTPDCRRSGTARRREQRLNRWDSMAQTDAVGKHSSCVTPPPESPGDGADAPWPRRASVRGPGPAAETTSGLRQRTDRNTAGRFRQPASRSDRVRGVEAAGVVSREKFVLRCLWADHARMPSRRLAVHVVALFLACTHPAMRVEAPPQATIATETPGPSQLATVEEQQPASGMGASVAQEASVSEDLRAADATVVANTPSNDPPVVRRGECFVRTARIAVCSGIEQPSPPPLIPVELCDGCLTSADCRAAPRGRCVEVPGNTCRPSTRACRYPRDGCSRCEGRPSSARAGCVNDGAGHAVCAELSPPPPASRH